MITSWNCQMTPSLNNGGFVFNYLLYELRETNRVCKSVWFWGVLDVIVTTLWCGEMPFFVNYLMNSFVPTESVFWGRRRSVWSEAKGQLRGMIILNWCYCLRISNLPCLLPKILVICCFKVFLTGLTRERWALRLCSLDNERDTRNMLRLPYSATTFAVVHRKENVAGMTQTRIVLGMDDEHCQGCRTQRRRLLSTRHVMRNFDRGGFHGATLKLHAMVRAILIAASDRKDPIRLVLRLYCRQQSI